MWLNFFFDSKVFAGEIFRVEKFFEFLTVTES